MEDLARVFHIVRIYLCESSKRGSNINPGATHKVRQHILHAFGHPLISSRSRRGVLSLSFCLSLFPSLPLSLSPCFPWNPRRRNRARNIIPFQSSFDRAELLGVIITLLLSPSFDRTVKRTYYTFVIRSIVCPTFSVRLYRYTAIDAAFRVKKKKREWGRGREGEK